MYKKGNAAVVAAHWTRHQSDRYTDHRPRIGTILAIYGLVGNVDKKKVIGIMDLAIKDTGSIMLITGAGVHSVTLLRLQHRRCTRTAIAATPLPAILIPFIIAACMRLALGSATVAITTAASISAGLIGTIAVSPLLMANSSCVARSPSPTSTTPGLVSTVCSACLI
jgi:H+/gluconate symporter-like permease